MNILFLSLLDFASFEERNIYCDLLREYIRNGHQVTCISPAERRNSECTRLLQFGENCILKLKIGNIQKVGLLEKGISTLLIEPLFIEGIKKYFPAKKFDLVLYATPPVTFAKVIQFVKKRDNACSFLLLKDIFPQNAVDIGMMRKTGLYGILYRYFRKKEKKLYQVSDHIGCMSPANVKYVLDHNPEVRREKVSVSPNAVEVQALAVSDAERAALRRKYDIPEDKLVFVYGGNLGKPQGIPFLIACLRTQRENTDCFFLIVGDGTEYGKLQRFVEQEPQENVRLMRRLPKEDYDRMVAACDVGMLFLDNRFTIPNFPSRLLAYMQAGLPVLACTDPNTDVGTVLTSGGLGWWCESKDPKQFAALVSDIAKQDLKEMAPGISAYLDTHYNVVNVYRDIMETLQ